MTNRHTADWLAADGTLDIDAACFAYLEELRWPEGVRCPRCNAGVISRIFARRQFDCDRCRYQFSVTAGTILHDTHVPLHKWFIAMHMMLQSARGVTVNQITGRIAVSYKTAWRLSRHIRAIIREIETSVPTTLADQRHRGLAGGNRRAKRRLARARARARAKERPSASARLVARYLNALGEGPHDPEGARLFKHMLLRLVGGVTPSPRAR
jgi:transposase-like protein